jgi:hypothetical protein
MNPAPLRPARFLLVALALLAAPAAAVAGGLEPNDYAYGAVLGVSGRSALYAAPLPLEVYRVATRADLADVCVVNGVGEVVPYALRRPAGERADAAPFAPLPLFPLRTADRSPSEALKLHLRSGTTSIDLDRPPEAGPAEVIRGYLLDARGAHEPLTTLRLAWPADAAEFSARVSVEASEDLAHWRTVARDAAIVNLHFGGQELGLDDGVLLRQLEADAVERQPRAEIELVLPRGRARGCRHRDRQVCELRLPRPPRAADRRQRQRRRRASSR